MGGWLRGSEPSKLKTTVKRVLYKVTKSARLSEQSGGSALSLSTWINVRGGLAWEHTRCGGGTTTPSGALCTHLQGWGRARGTRGCRKGAVGTWKLLYSGDGRKKAQGQRPQTMQTKHSLCSTAKQRGRAGSSLPTNPGAQQEAQAPPGSSTHVLRGQPWHAILSHPSCWGLGADNPPPTVSGREKEPTRSE